MSPMPSHHQRHNLELLPEASREGGRSPLIEIRDLRLIVAVAEEGSLTRAADRLNVTQPALSRHLKTVEARLGTELFARARSRLQLTPGGRVLLGHAREVLDRMVKVEDDVRGAGASERRVLRVGTQCYTAYHWLPAVLGRYAARHPRVTVELAFETQRRPLPLLLDGAIDIALMSDGWRRRELAATRLFSDEFVAVVPPGHPWSRRPYVLPDDLRHERLLLLVPPRDSTVMTAFLGPAGVRPAEVVDVQLLGALAALVTARLGVGVVPSWTIAPELRGETLVAVRLGPRGLHRLWVAATAKARMREPCIQSFVHLVASSGPAAGLVRPR